MKAIQTRKLNDTSWLAQTLQDKMNEFEIIRQIGWRSS